MKYITKWRLFIILINIFEEYKIILAICEFPLMVDFKKDIKSDSIKK